MKNIIDDFKINRLLRLAILLGAFFSINIFPMRMTEKGKAMGKKYLAQEKAGQEQMLLIKEWKKQEELREKKGLLIFLDDYEKEGLMAISFAFLTALYQEAGPILVSASLLYNVLECAKKDSEPIDVLLNEIKEESNIYKTVTDRATKRAISFSVWEKKVSAISRISFDPEKWIIKKVNDSLLLLLPKQYVESFDIADNKLEEYYQDLDLVSEIELKLGFKVNHMVTVHIEQLVKSQYIGLSDYFLDSLSTIFCKKADYSNTNITVPEWVIFVGGHGKRDYSIVNISLNDFKKLLEFLDKYINVRLLLLKSCYSLGVNSKKIYGDIKLGTQQYYSFPIVVQGINDIAAQSTNQTIDLPAWEHDKTIKIMTHMDFIGFFQKIKTLENNYDETIKTILEDYIENTPQIKFPGVEWFSVMDIDNKVVSIGSILVRTRDAQKPLDIVKFFKKDPEIILLYTEDIPFDLIINSIKLKAIVSMIPSPSPFGHVIHRIKKITSSQSFSKILQWFLVDLQAERKQFFIDEIGDKKDIFICDTGQSMGVTLAEKRVYFKDKNNDLFTAALEEGIKEIKIEKVESGSMHEHVYNLGIEIMEDANKEKESSSEISFEQIKKIEDTLKEQLRERNERESDVSHSSVD